MTQFVESYDDLVIGSDDRAKVYCKRADGFTIEENGVLSKIDITTVKGHLDFSHLYLNGKRITGIATFAFRGSQNVTSVVIPKNVVSVSSYAFSLMNNRIIILCKEKSEPSTWANVWDNGHVVVWDALGEVKEENGFKYAPLSTGGASIVGYDKNNGTSVTIPEVFGDKPITEIASSAFWASAIVSIIVPKTVVTIRKGAFSYSKSLINVTLNEGIKIIEGGAFSNCTKLSTINFPNSLTTIGDSAFHLTANLKEIKLPDSITYLGISAFSYSNVTSINLPKSVTEIGRSTFSNTHLQTLTIHSGITSIGSNAFFLCNDMTEIFIPKTVTTIESGAFSKCEKLVIRCEATEKPAGWHNEWTDVASEKIMWNSKA